MKDYYSAPKEYIISPFSFIHNNPDVPITDEAIIDTLQSVIDIDDLRLDKDLPYLEHLIKLDSLSYIRKGAEYATIKFKQLYKHGDPYGDRRGYSNFDLYAKEVLKTSTRSVVAHINASRVALELIMAGFEYEELPHNVSQACCLAQYSGEELIEVWKYVISELAPHERTATSIRNLLNPPKVTKEDLYTKIELPLAIYEKVLNVAYHAKLSVSKLLDNVFSVLTGGFKKQEIIAFIKWVLDMNNLLGEI